MNGWAANTGTTPVGRIQIGDTAAKTWTANFDDVIVDNGGRMTAGPTREWSEAGRSVDVKGEGYRVKRNKVAIIGALAVVMTCAMAVAPSFAAGPGTPFTWGNNAFGQLGNGTTTAHPLPPR